MFSILPISVIINFLAPHPSKISSTLLDSYEGYNCIIHVDNLTFHNVSNFLHVDNPVAGKFIYNHDKPGLMLRPAGHKFVNLVYLLDPQRFESFSNTKFNVKYEDVIVFVVANYAAVEKENVWESMGVERAASLIIYDIESSDFFYVKFYFGDQSKVVNRIPEVGNLLDYVNDFKDFNWHMFTIGYADFKPFFWCEGGQYSNDTCDVRGAEGFILNELSTRYKFNYTFINYEDTWNAMVVEVSERKLDWALGGITASRDRFSMVDFTDALYMEHYEAIFTIPDAVTLEWGFTLVPFQLPVWFCMISFFFTFAALMKFSYYYLQSNTRQLQMTNSDFLMIPFRAFLEQPQSRGVPTSKLTFRVILIILWIFEIILVTCYKSKLTSTAIKPTNLLPSTLEDLLAENYRIQLNKYDWSVLKACITDSNDPIYMEVLQKGHADLGYCDAALATSKDHVAFIEEKTPLKMQLIEGCGDVFTKKHLHSMRITSELLFPNAHAWPLQLQSPFRRSFSSLIQKMQAVGLFELWYAPTSKFKVPDANEMTAAKITAAIQMQNLADPFFILLIGHSLASVVFLMEILLTKYGSLISV